MTELKEIITRQNLHNLAGNRSFGRGEDYFERGLVGPVAEKNGVISAKVHGSHAYETRLKIVAAPQGKVRLDHFCERLGALHLAACKAAKPDPVDLAKRLFDFEMLDSNLDLFYDAPQVYKTILGKPGLAEYRRLAEKEWSRVEEKGPGSRDTGYSGKRWRITSIMESRAKADGDVDALIA